MIAHFLLFIKMFSHPKQANYQRQQRQQLPRRESESPRIKTLVDILDTLDAATETGNFDKLQMIEKAIFNVTVCNFAKSLHIDKNTPGEDQQIAFLKRMAHQPWYFCKKYQAVRNHDHKLCSDCQSSVQLINIAINHRHQLSKISPQSRTTVKCPSDIINNWLELIDFMGNKSVENNMRNAAEALFPDTLPTNDTEKYARARVVSNLILTSDHFSGEIALKFVYRYKFHRILKEYITRNTQISIRQRYPYRDEEMELTDALRAIDGRFGKVGDFLRNPLNHNDILLLDHCNGRLQFMKDLLRALRYNEYHKFLYDSNQILNDINL